MAATSRPQIYNRLQDLVPPPAEAKPLTTTQLVGRWQHTDPQPHGIRLVRIAATDAVSFECFGSGGPLPTNSAPVLLNHVLAANPSSTDGMAFLAEIDFGFLSSRFQGNVNLGLLVLAGFHDFKNGSGRSNYFSREFFYSTAVEIDSLGQSFVADKGTGSSQFDSSSLVGLWRNTNSGSLGIPIIEISERNEGLAVHAFGTGEQGQVDWGETPAKAYAKDWLSTEAMAFSACFESQAINCHLQANVKQGVLVVAYFTIFSDGSGRSNYFCREFYYKDR
jgi:hypothetical protein